MKDLAALEAPLDSAEALHARRVLLAVAVVLLQYYFSNIPLQFSGSIFIFSTIAPLHLDEYLDRSTAYESKAASLEAPVATATNPLEILLKLILGIIPS